MKRDPTVFVRGAVSHADHATIHLDCYPYSDEDTAQFMAIVPEAHW